MKTMLEKMRNRQIPDYYPTMYQDGYKPYEILEAASNSIYERYTERQQETEAEPTSEPLNVRFQVEVKHR